MFPRKLLGTRKFDMENCEKRSWPTSRFEVGPDGVSTDRRFMMKRFMRMGGCTGERVVRWAKNRIDQWNGMLTKTMSSMLTREPNC